MGIRSKQEDQSFGASLAFISEPPSKYQKTKPRFPNLSPGPAQAQALTSARKGDSHKHTLEVKNRIFPSLPTTAKPAFWFSQAASTFAFHHPFPGEVHWALPSFKPIFSFIKFYENLPHCLEGQPGGQHKDPTSLEGSKPVMLLFWNSICRKRLEP